MYRDFYSDYDINLYMLVVRLCSVWLPILKRTEWRKLTTVEFRRMLKYCKLA